MLLYCWLFCVAKILVKTLVLVPKEWDLSCWTEFVHAMLYLSNAGMAQAPSSDQGENDVSRLHAIYNPRLRIDASCYSDASSFPTTCFNQNAITFRTQNVYHAHVDAMAAFAYNSGAYSSSFVSRQINPKKAECLHFFFLSPFFSVLVAVGRLVLALKVGIPVIISVPVLETTLAVVLVR